MSKPRKPKYCRVGSTPKQNKWTQGAYFNKQINRMVSCGMSLIKAELFAIEMRGC